MPRGHLTCLCLCEGRVSCSCFSVLTTWYLWLPSFPSRSLKLSPSHLPTYLPFALGLTFERQLPSCLRTVVPSTLVSFTLPLTMPGVSASRPPYTSPKAIITRAPSLDTFPHFPAPLPKLLTQISSQAPDSASPPSSSI